MKTRFKLGAAVGGLMALCGAGVSAQELPNTMVWTSYDVGSAGYAEASAIADAFGKEFGTRVRIQPSGSGIGRLQPLLQGRADYALGQLILDGEDIIKVPVIPLTPNLAAACCVQQLRRDTNSVPSLAHAALQDVPHT